MPDGDGDGVGGQRVAVADSDGQLRRRVRYLAGRRGLGLALTGAIIGGAGGLAFAVVTHNANRSVFAGKLPAPGYGLSFAVAFCLVGTLGVLATCLAVARAKPSVERVGLGNAGFAPDRDSGPSLGSGPRAWVAPTPVVGVGSGGGPGPVTRAKS